MNVRNSDRAAGTEPGRVQLAPGTDALRVSLTLPEEPSPAARYRAELQNRAGEIIYEEAGGRDGQSVTVLIPAAGLTRERYVLKLFASGADGVDRPVGNYFFNVE